MSARIMSQFIRPCLFDEIWSFFSYHVNHWVCVRCWNYWHYRSVNYTQVFYSVDSQFGIDHWILVNSHFTSSNLQIKKLLYIMSMTFLNNHLMVQWKSVINQYAFDVAVWSKRQIFTAWKWIRKKLRPKTSKSRWFSNLSKKEFSVELLVKSLAI